MEKKDYSKTCNRNDNDPTNPCQHCMMGVWPIGCMIDEIKGAYKNETDSESGKQSTH